MIPLEGHLLVIGAHAGDVENMAAATVLKHVRAGCTATVVHMTLGEAGHPTLPPDIYAEPVSYTHLTLPTSDLV